MLCVSKLSLHPSSYYAMPFEIVDLDLDLDLDLSP